MALDGREAQRRLVTWRDVAAWIDYAADEFRADAPMRTDLHHVGQCVRDEGERRYSPRAAAARYDGAWELPVLGPVPPPTAVLIRPDGYVAWVGDGTDTGLREAMTTWFGAR